MQGGQSDSKHNLMQSKFAKDSHQEMRAFGHGALYLGGMFPSNKLFTQVYCIPLHSIMPA